LTSVAIPESVTELGAGAFLYCTGLKSVTLPDNFKHLGTGAFYGCGLEFENKELYLENPDDIDYDLILDMIDAFGW